MKIITSLAFAFALSAQAELNPMDLKNCDTLYFLGGEKLFESVDCAMALLPQAENSAEQKLLYERAFISLSLVVNMAPKTPSERTAIERALLLLKKMSTTLTSSADYAYWTAVFTSFNAVMLDRGSVVPLKMFAAIRSIEENLNLAITREAFIHGMGPKRVLGIMNTQMPAIAGGDKALAENMLKDAYQRAPEFSINHVEYARILYVNGKTNDARDVLERFLALDSSALNPYLNEPLRAPRVELARDRKEAQSILTSIDEDEA